MKKLLTRITLAAAAILLLGSCAEINERLDNLDKRLSGLGSNNVATIDTQVANISSSIADLGTIRKNIQDLTATTAAQAQDIKDLNNEDTEIGKEISDLKKADESLNKRIDDLQKYVNDTLKSYGTKEWVNATFSTLSQYEATCDTIAKIDARLGSMDTRLSKSIEDCADSLKAWVNVQLDGYYTIAEMDAKVAEMKAQIDTLRSTTAATADSLAAEITDTKTAIDTARAQLTREYKSAIATAITELDGKLSNELQKKIDSVNTVITNLTTRVSTLETSLPALEGRVDVLEKRIQSVSIVPSYADGGVKVEKDTMYLELIVKPEMTVASLEKSNITILLTEVKTKAVNLTVVPQDSIKSFDKDAINGIISMKTVITEFIPATIDSSLAVAVNVTVGTLSDYTTAFSPLTLKNVMIETTEEETKVIIKPSDSSTPKAVSGEIPVDEGFDQTKPTSIEVSGIGTIIFDETATEKILANAAEANATKVYFKVEDVSETKPVSGYDLVYEVTMKTVDENGTEVYSETKAAGTATIVIPLDEDIEYINGITLVNESGQPVEGGVVPDSMVFDEENHTLTFKVNHFSKYAVDYVTSSQFIHITSVSLDTSKMALMLNGSIQLNATINPFNATNNKITWTSSNTSVATVDKNGTVKAVAIGSATITATTVSDTQTATCAITVKEPEFVEIIAKYDGVHLSSLKWVKQNLSNTASGSKSWKGDNASAITVPGSADEVVIGDKFKWETSDTTTLILGSDWRTPTSAEFGAMKDVTYWAWDDLDNGYYVYAPLEGDAGKNNADKASGHTYNKVDALLFFPAAGKDSSEEGTIGYYWSSTSSGEGKVTCLKFSNNEVVQMFNETSAGFSIRPVSTGKPVSGTEKYEREDW